MPDLRCSARGYSVVYIGWKKCMRVSAGKPEVKHDWEELDIDFGGILKWVLKQEGRLWTGFVWLRTRTRICPLSTR
jgi:hypothetical protein